MVLFTEMNPQMPSRLPLVLENYPSLLGLELLMFITVDGDVSLDREFLRGYPRGVMAIFDLSFGP